MQWCNELQKRLNEELQKFFMQVNAEETKLSNEFFNSVKEFLRSGNIEVDYQNEFTLTHKTNVDLKFFIETIAINISGSWLWSYLVNDTINSAFKKVTAKYLEAATLALQELQNMVQTEFISYLDMRIVPYLKKLDSFINSQIDKQSVVERLIKVAQILKEQKGGQT